MTFDFGVSDENDNKATLKAPNGKASNLSAEQHRLVRTPAFKAWFGDWEEAYSTGNYDGVSKVLDENGEPLVVYHGTKSNFTIFNMVDRIKEFDVRDYGAYFTNDKETAKVYSLDFSSPTEYSEEIEKKYQQALQKWLESKTQDDLEALRKLSEQRVQLSQNLLQSFHQKYVIECFLNIKTPYVFDAKGKLWSEVLVGKVDTALDNNNDGIIMKNMVEVNSIVQTTYIAFKPNQIKLADGSNTTFDSNNPDIRFAEGGKIPKTRKMVVIIRNIKNPNETDAKGVANKYKGAYKRIYDILNEDAVFIEHTHEEEVMRGNDYFLFFDFVPDYDAIQQIKNIKNVEVIDENVDEFIANFNTTYAKGGEIDYSDYKTAIVALQNEHGDFLILQRGSTAPWMPNKWSLVGGVVDAGEEPLDSAIREVKEEIGVDVSNLYFVTHQNTNDSGHLYFYKGKLPKGYKIELDYENQDFAWVNKHNYSSYDYVPHIKDFLELMTFVPDELPKFELGGIYHGSPHTFDKFSTDYMGSGEGVQAFGWGLYFTSLQDIARNYAEQLSKKSFKGTNTMSKEDVNKLSDKNITQSEFEEIRDRNIERITRILNNIPELERLGYIEKGKNPILAGYGKQLYDLDLNALLKAKSVNDVIATPNLYNVTLHKGKTPDQYTWLDWDEYPLSENVKSKIITAILKENPQETPFKNRTDLINEVKSAKNTSVLYSILSMYAFSQKEASLFLLRAGFDGIKYTAESRSKGATSDNTRGFNYVVFDDSAITIEEVQRFAEGGQTETLIAPNGQPSNLNPEQWHLVRTPEFKKWFGDWEEAYRTRNYDGVSKVIDENGEPLVVYRGSTANTRNVSGLWLTESKQYAEGFGGVNQYFVKVINPMPENLFDKTWMVDFNLYDGRLGDFHKIVVKEASQILLSDSSNTDIRFADGGQTETLIAPDEKSNPVKEFFTWYKNWYKPISGKMNIMFSVPNELHLEELLAMMTEENVVVMELFEKTDQNIDAKPYMRQICEKADELGITIYLEPNPRYKYFAENTEKRNKVSKQYLFDYYSNFGFEPTSDKRFMKRTPKMKAEIPNILFKKGGQININDYMLLTYHEEVGNWFVAKNEVYLWLYDDMDAGKKLQSGEYDYVLFPPTPPIGMAFKKNFVPPLLQVWTKKYQKEHKGSEKLMAVIRAWYDEKNHKLYLLMMTTRKDLQRKGIISSMIKELRKQFNVEQEDVIFDDPTEQGKSVMESKKFDKGGIASTYDKLYAVKSKFFNLFHAGFLKGYGNYQGVMLRIKDHIANWDNFYNYNLSWLENGENPYLLSIVINDEYNEPLTYKYGQESESRLEDFISEYQDKYPDLKAKEFVFGADSSIEDIIWTIEHEVNKINGTKRFDKGGQTETLLSPNGKPSNLTPEQWHLVRTPEFKNWFGDWENDPENASKVVDENGEPKVVFHGTRLDFTVFDKDKVSKNNKWGEGFYFTDNYEYAKGYANSRFSTIKHREPLMVFINVRDIYDIHKSTDRTEYVVKEPTDIKLADGTNTNFDPSNPDIRFDKGGETPNIHYSPILKNTEIVKDLKLTKNLLSLSHQGLSGGIKAVWDYPYENVSNVVIAYMNSKPIGVITDTNGVQNIFVKSEYRGFGIGKSLKNILNNIRFKKGGEVDYKKLELERIAAKYKDLDFDLSGNAQKKVRLAPNGKPSKLNEVQYKAVRSANFINWFGDWQKAYKTGDYTNVSKCIDENGEPLIVYRGHSKKEASRYTKVFNYQVNRFALNRNPNRFAFYFTESYFVASQYGGGDDEGIVTPYFLNIREMCDFTPTNPEYPNKIEFSLPYFDKYDKIWIESLVKIKEGKVTLANFKDEIPEAVISFFEKMQGRVTERNFESFKNLIEKKANYKMAEIVDENKKYYSSHATLKQVIKMIDPNMPLSIMDTNDTHYSNFSDFFNKNFPVFFFFIHHISFLYWNVPENTDLILKNEMVKRGFTGGKFLETTYAENSPTGTEMVYFNFYPEDVKLADGSNYTFRPDVKDTDYGDGGMIMIYPD